MTSAPRQPEPTTPRVLLFGHPGSGKSSLLGALLRASETQPEDLGAEVIDQTGRLAAIRDHVYSGAEFQNTRTELVSYPLQLRPQDADGKPLPHSEPVLVMDCDGTAADALFKNAEALSERRVRGTVAAAVVSADAIALTVNAGADEDELRDAFEDFQMFLERVHGRKAFAREVGGFPAYLVLTQCDRLARPGDTTRTWEARIGARKEFFLKRFAEFLEEAGTDTGGDTPYLAFGSMDLDAYATAVRMPRLADDPRPFDEPYGVAELFRDLFAAAREHRDRVTASDRRLWWTGWSALAAITAMLLGVVAVFALQPPPADPGLADRVRAYQQQEPSEAAVRLGEKNVTREKRALAGFKGDPAFESLPSELRGFVEGRLKEIDDYQAYRAKLAAATAPADTRTLEDLASVEAALTGEFALPSPEAYSWGQTEAGRLREKWLADVPLIREAEARWEEWYRGLVRRANELTLSPGFEGGWRVAVERLVAESQQPPWDVHAAIPGSPVVAQPRGEAVTYRVPFEFDRVYQARRDWEFTRERLLDLRDLADAVGLTVGANHPDPLLILPEPGAGVDSAALPGDRLAALRKAYPRASDNIREWDLRGFPDPGRTLIANRLRDSFAAGVRHTQRLILAKLGTPPEARDNPDGWQQVAAALGEPAFQNWGRLLHLLARLSDSSAADPVAELAAFLRTDRFTLDPKGFTLDIPTDLRVPEVMPSGPLTITATPRGGPPASRTFARAGAGRKDGLVTRYEFTPDAGGPLTYRPGDELKAELPVRSGNQEFRLLWDVGGTATFQFDRLTREPRLVRVGSPPEPAAGVRLTPAAGSVLPRPPVLLPELRR